ncbi:MULTISPECIES: hypothetical protein [unclassified Paraburkholderia]|uniref:hypothetical protein n=1 Tax=unclassified Paraburkholderia TaxID=2615204 RepID=UPI00161BFF96|nr:MULTISPECIES: hypothetical protein [unclassified Paraburkholderia]MBB5448221.1 hypothetical protein [Paraburkholderia sp. WSM4177]MBB5488604.1 hypothetical protein [Paraburkholderia sp. WSM4180]
MKQFAYQDAHGVVYPAHPALAFQPGLIPGQYDSETRTFTPQGNPKEQVGVIITDAGAGGRDTLQSGLRDDRGAGTAPINSGVAFTLPADNSAEYQARIVELEQELSDERERSAALEAQVLTLQSHLDALTSAGGATDGGASGEQSERTAHGEPGTTDAPGADGAAQSIPPESDPPPVPAKRARKAS